MLAPGLVRRVRPGFVMAGGLALSAAGLAILALVNTASDLATLVLASVILFGGIAPAFTLATDLIVGTAPPERAGAASAISETSTELGGALGIAILGSIGAAVYRGAIATAIPKTIPASVSGAARGTLGGALSLAERLPHGLGTELISAARTSFIQGLQVTAIVAAIATIATAVIAAIVLKDVPAGSQDPSADD
jgi:DHA2 family multidrug resistance protein-like MFS transporter